MLLKLDETTYQLTYDVPVKGIPPVNGYVILADRPILIDGGASDDKTYAAFRQDLDELRIKPSDLGAVLVTHNHLDHIGLASRLAKELDVPVHVHEDEWYMVTANEERREGFRDTVMETILFWGVPEIAVQAMHGKIMNAVRFGGGIPMEKVRPYPKKDFKVCGLCLDPIHCPGHTEGLVCLWWPEKKAIFSNDQVLETISPNPTIYMQPRHGRRTGLADYLDSLGSIEHLPVQKIYPGHGHSFNNLKGRIGEIRGFALERRQQILALLKDATEPMTILEITMKVWENLDPVQIFLGSREVHGFMEIFTQEGLVIQELREKVGTFRLDRDKFRKTN